jgi:hypothetical protein
MFDTDLPIRPVRQIVRPMAWRIMRPMVPPVGALGHIAGARAGTYICTTAGKCAATRNILTAGRYADLISFRQSPINGIFSHANHAIIGHCRVHQRQGGYLGITRAVSAAESAVP